MVGPRGIQHLQKHSHQLLIPADQSPKSMRAIDDNDIVTVTTRSQQTAHDA